MKVLILDTLIRQTAITNDVSANALYPTKSKIPKDAIKRIYQEYRNLVKLEKQGANSIIEYLRKMQDGRHMEGAKNIFKYRLTAGDRILYTYGKYLPYIKEKDPNSLVLLGYSKHDEQALLARNKNFQNIEKYKKASDIVKLLDDYDLKNISDAGIDIEDLCTISKLLLEPSSFDNYVKYVVADEEFANKNIEELEVKLNTEQQSCIDCYSANPQPTLILGGGGCGKTLIAIHLLKEYDHKRNKNNVYFTQSRELREKIKKQYKEISYNNKPDDITPNVLDINDFCIQQLSLNRKNLITTTDFYKFINENNKIKSIIKKENINAQDIWAEIRGTIKGSMQSTMVKDIAWQRNTFANQDNFVISNIEQYIERQHNKKEFTLKYSVKETKEKIKLDNNLKENETDKAVLNDIIKYFYTFNYKENAISKNTYLKLSEEESTLEKSSRELLYEIYLEYKKYCANNLFDENDLVCMMFEKFGEDNLPKFDFIVVDEVQDYTELQIYLIYKMCKTSNGIVFAGDSHQMINPTMFSIKRLRELFFDHKNKQLELQIKFLSKNYRCQQGIINVANNLSDERRSIIGKKETEEEQYEYSIKKGENPFRLNYSKDNLIYIIDEIMKYPSTSLLVANDFEKNKIINLYGKSKYEANKISKIFTVAEIKGMEYQYVVCFNLISTYRNIWEQLVKKIKGKKTSKYRFYFNLIYVAITRAQKHLCFIDEYPLDDLESIFDLSYINNFDKDKLLFSTLTSSFEAWLQDAKNYEMQGKYKEALEIYEERFPEDEKNIYRCLAHIEENNKEYSSAIQYYMLLNDMDAIKYLIEEIKDDNLDLYNLGKSLINPSIITYDNKYDKQTILNLINKIFYNKKEASQVKLYTVKRLNEFIEKMY